MRATIDAAGRIVIPKRLRDAVGLDGPAEIELSVHNGKIELEPASRPARFERVGIVVIPIIDGAEPDPDFDLDKHREEMERERFGL